MFERFTVQARDVVTRAQAEADGLGHSYIGTEHLLLALLPPSTGTVAALLADAGVTAQRVRADIERLVGTGTGALGDGDAEALRSLGIDLDEVRAKIEESFGPGALDDLLSTRRRGVRRWFAGRTPFSEHAKKVLALALREAVRLRHNWIDEGHLLLGLIRDGGGTAATILVDAGVDLDALRDRTVAAMRRAA
ncbi:MAG TPA: Clp protease N-terminal domain-containing protein [Micromonosporaceae bacterium]